MNPEQRALHEASAIRLWAGRAPLATGDTAADLPVLHPVLPPRGADPVGAVIVMPGGGYASHATHEGLPIAEYFRRQGLAAFVLQYRLKPYSQDVALLDAKRSVRLLRARSAEFGIDPNRIAVIGFSAGGHLAANLSTHADGGLGGSKDPVERQSCRPQTALLVYPGIVSAPIRRATPASRSVASLLTLGGLHQAVNAGTPPTFLIVSHEDDRALYEHSFAYAAKLHEAGVRFELHILGYGPHGFGMRGTDLRLRAWPQLVVNWLDACGFFPAGLPTDGTAAK
jgi:acetyl esterase/lipase